MKKWREGGEKAQNDFLTSFLDKGVLLAPISILSRYSLWDRLLLAEQNEEGIAFAAIFIQLQPTGLLFLKGIPPNQEEEIYINTSCTAHINYLRVWAHAGELGKQFCFIYFICMPPNHEESRQLMRKYKSHAFANQIFIYSILFCVRSWPLSKNPEGWSWPNLCKEEVPECGDCYPKSLSLI